MKKHIEQASAFIGARCGAAPSPAQLELLDAYAALVLEKNRDFNLTAASDAREIWLRHIADGAAALPLLRHLLNAKPAPLLADAGAGAGFTGITLKILWPELSVRLADSLSKRCAFMEWACAKLGLAGIKTERARLGQDRMAISADAVIERAMGRLEDVAPLCAGIAAPGGYFIAYRSSPQEAGAAFPQLENAPAPAELLSYSLPGENERRYFNVFRKTAA